MKKLARFLAVVCIVATMGSIFAFPAAAANTTNIDIEDFKATVLGYQSIDPARKDNDTSIYLCYWDSTHSAVRVKAYGATSSSGGWTNRTWYNGYVTYVSCTVDVAYSIRSYINESGETYAKLGFHSTYSSPNYITGHWSPDSSGVYTVAVP